VGSSPGKKHHRQKETMRYIKREALLSVRINTPTPKELEGGEKQE